MKYLLCRVCSSTFLAYDLSKKPVSVQGETSCPWGGFGMQPQKFPPSQQAHVTNVQQKYQSVPGWQNPVTGHQTHATYQQQQSRNVRDQQIPIESQKLHSDAGSKNAASAQGASDPKNKGTAGSNFTDKAGTCNSKKVSTAANNEENSAGRTESPISSSHKRSRQSQNVPDQQTPVANQQQQCEKPPFSAESKNFRGSSQKENNVASEKDLGGCRNGSDNLTDSPVTKRTRKGYPSCNAGKSNLLNLIATFVNSPMMNPFGLETLSIPLSIIKLNLQGVSQQFTLPACIIRKQGHHSEGAPRPTLVLALQAFPPLAIQQVKFLNGQLVKQVYSRKDKSKESIGSSEEEGGKEISTAATLMEISAELQHSYPDGDLSRITAQKKIFSVV